MKFGLNLFSLRTLIATEADLIRTVTALRDMGYDHLHYSGAPFDAEMLSRVIRETGLPVLLTHVPMERIIKDTERLVEEHLQIGCPNVGLGMMPTATLVDETACKKTVEDLERAAERIEALGCRFSYHHHSMEFMRHGGESVFDYMLKNAPHVRFTADTYWLQHAGVDVVAFLEKLRGRVDCVHLKDYQMVAKRENEKWRVVPTFAPVGEGNMDFHAIIAKMKEIGVEHYFVEQDDAVQYENPLDPVGRSIRYLKGEFGA